MDSNKILKSGGLQKVKKERLLWSPARTQGKLPPGAKQQKKRTNAVSGKDFPRGRFLRAGRPIQKGEKKGFTKLPQIRNANRLGDKSKKIELNWGGDSNF